MDATSMHGTRVSECHLPPCFAYSQPQQEAA